MPPAGPYRESAHDVEGEPLEAPPLSGTTRAVLGAAAASTIAGAAALGSVELAVLAGFGALAAVLDLVRAGRLRASHRCLIRFLGSETVRRERDALRSLDGSRRVRRAPGSGGVRFEVLSDDGRRTLASYRVLEGPTESELSALPLDVRFARVHGRSLQPVCFDGPPPDLGGEVRSADARWLRVSRFAGGVLVERLDGFGDLLGDTWHPDLASAREQVDEEYGLHAGPLKSRPPAWDEPAPRVWT